MLYQQTFNKLLYFFFFDNFVKMNEKDFRLFDQEFNYLF